MAEFGNDDIDRMLEDGLTKEQQRHESQDRSRARRRSRSPGGRRRRSRSTSEQRRAAAEQRRLQKEAEDIDRDRRTVFACQIHPRVDERDIFEFFSQCGKVRDVQLIRDAKTSKSKGLAYIEFHDHMSVAQALTFSGQLLGNYPISVQVTQSEKNRAAAAAAATTQREGSMKVYVSGVHKNIDSEDLKEIFEPFGPLDACEVGTAHDAQGNLTGFVIYERASDAMDALQHLNGLSLLGQSITLSQVDISQMSSIHPAAAVFGVTGTGAPPSDPAALLSGAAGGVAGVAGGMPGGAVGSGPNTAALQQASAVAAAAVAQIGGGDVNSSVPGAGVLDEGHGGMAMSANSRLALMQRLQGGAGNKIDPNVSASMTMQSLLPNMPKAPQPTRFLQLKNMFDPTKETERGWEDDIALDVKDECSKYGQVLHCKVDKNSLGHVYLKFSTVNAAQQAQMALNGRWFAQKQISATFLPQETYEQRYPKSRNL